MNAVIAALSIFSSRFLPILYFLHLLNTLFSRGDHRPVRAIYKSCPRRRFNGAMSCWVRCDHAPIHARQTPDRTISGQSQFCIDLWSRRFRGRTHCVGLLFRSDLFPRSGIHQDLRQPLWIAAQSSSGLHGDEQPGGEFSSGGKQNNNLDAFWDSLAPRVKMRAAGHEYR